MTAADELTHYMEAVSRLSAQVDELEESESRLQAEVDSLRAERDDYRKAANGLSADLSRFGARLDRAEGIIHSALVTNSDPVQALREVLDVLGGESIPVARG